MTGISNNVDHTQDFQAAYSTRWRSAGSRPARTGGFSLVEMAVALAITAAFTIVTLNILRDQLQSTNADGFANDTVRLFNAINQAYTGVADFSSLSPQTLQQLGAVSTDMVTVTASGVQLSNRYNGRVYVQGWGKTAADPRLYQLIQSTSIPMAQCRRIAVSLTDQLKNAPRLLSYLIALASPSTQSGTRVDEAIPNPLMVNAAGNIVGGANTGFVEPVIIESTLSGTGGINVSALASFCEQDINFFTVIMLGPKF